MSRSDANAVPVSVARVSPGGGARLVAGIGAWLPTGRGLPPEVWRRRHRGVLLLLLGQAAALFVFGVVRGFGLGHAAIETLPILLLTAAAGQGRGGTRLRSAAATLGLIFCSAVLVHLSGGVIEAHFHFFAMVGVITLYQHWLPFGLAIAFVAAHHGLATMVDPGSVYNHYAALNNPWKWALIHTAFVLFASATNVYAWRMNEEAAGELKTYRLRLDEEARRRRSALELNDNVVQGLAVVASAIDLGQDALARETASRTIVAARSIITDLLGDEEAAPGALRRHEAATVAE